MIVRGGIFTAVQLNQVPSVLLRQYRRGEGQPVGTDLEDHTRRKCFSLPGGAGALLRASSAIPGCERGRVGACGCVRVRAGAHARPSIGMEDN